jgi:hypothetical protein
MNEANEGEFARVSRDPLAKGQAEQDPASTKKQIPDESGHETSAMRQRWITRFSHLKLLQEFSNKHLAAQHETYARIKTGDLKKIAYEDLCFLFTPGDIVYFKVRGYEQLGRVYSVIGGQQRKGKPQKDKPPRQYNPFTGEVIGKLPEESVQSQARGSWTPVTIDYYTMESDGFYLGPKDHCKQITRYSGERVITELAIFPLRFHEKKDEIMRRLTERGRRYCSSYGHKSYRGITCPEIDKETPEEVFGDMFVDMKDYYRVPEEEAYNMYYRPSKPELGKLQPIQPDSAETEEEVNNSTYHLFDREVDEKAFDDFIFSHQHETELVRLGSDLVQEEVLQFLPHWVPAYFFRTRRYGNRKVLTCPDGILINIWYRASRCEPDARYR